jgi:diacylglycerol kinase (ATP)
VSALAELKHHRARLVVDDLPPIEQDVFNVIVANARSAGGGTTVAPGANPEDGQLDLVIVRYDSVLDLADTAGWLAAGNYTEASNVSHVRARRVRIESDPPMTFNVDGEVIGEGTLEATVKPAAVRAIVGPAYRPELPEPA